MTVLNILMQNETADFDRIVSGVIAESEQENVKTGNENTPFDPEDILL